MKKIVVYKCLILLVLMVANISAQEYRFEFELNLDPTVTCQLHQGEFLNRETLWWFDVWSEDNIEATLIDEKMSSASQCGQKTQTVMADVTPKKAECKIMRLSGKGAKVGKVSRVINIDNVYKELNFASMDTCIEHALSMFTKKTATSQEKILTGRPGPMQRQIHIPFVITEIEYRIQSNEKTYQGVIKKNYGNELDYETVQQIWKFQEHMQNNKSVANSGPRA